MRAGLLVLVVHSRGQGVAWYAERAKDRRAGLLRRRPHGEIVVSAIAGPVPA